MPSDAMYLEFLAVPHPTSTALEGLRLPVQNSQFLRHQTSTPEGSSRLLDGIPLLWYSLSQRDFVILLLLLMFDCLQQFFFEFGVLLLFLA